MQFKECKLGDRIRLILRFSGGDIEKEATIIGFLERWKIYFIGVKENIHCSKTTSLLNHYGDAKLISNYLEYSEYVIRYPNEFYIEKLHNIYLPDQKCVQCQICMPHLELKICKMCEFIRCLN